MTQNEEIQKRKTEWSGQFTCGKSIRTITHESYGFRKEIDDASRTSRKEIREMMSAYKGVKHRITPKKGLC